MVLHRFFFIFMMLILNTITFSSVIAQQANLKAVAVIHPTKGNQVNGILTFTDTGKGVRIVGDLYGLKPGEHGFHIHEFGDCSASDAKSAGEHYNPTNKKHGCPNDPEHHVGDLGNILVERNGHVHVDLLNRDIKLQGNLSVIGRAVIIHEKKDDCTSQPSGNAGSRLGCGVIGIAK